jgi:protein TonB
MKKKILIILCLSISCLVNSIIFIENFNSESNDKVYVYTDVDAIPKFDNIKKDFSNYIYENIKWSELFDGVSGKVIVSFVITKEGKISNVKIEKSLTNECDKEAIRVIQSSPDWIPGEKNGKTVNVLMYYPVVFKLQ